MRQDFNTQRGDGPSTFGEAAAPVALALVLCVVLDVVAFSFLFRYQFIFPATGMAASKGFSNSVASYCLAGGLGVAVALPLILRIRSLGLAAYCGVLGTGSAAALYTMGYAPVLLVVIAVVAVFALAAMGVTPLVSTPFAIAIPLAFFAVAVGTPPETATKAQADNPSISVLGWVSSSSDQREAFVVSMMQDAAKKCGLENLTIKVATYPMDEALRIEGSTIILNKNSLATESPSYDRIHEYEYRERKDDNGVVQAPVPWVFESYTGPDEVCVAALHAVAHMAQEQKGLTETAYAEDSLEHDSEDCWVFVNSTINTYVTGRKQLVT